MHAPRGFTLTEVAFSLLILVVAVLATIALLPLGLRAQQHSRYQMYAAAKAQELIDGFVQHQLDYKYSNTLAYRDMLALENSGVTNRGPGDRGMKDNRVNSDPKWAFLTNGTHQANGSFDLERVVATQSGGNYPVPLDIARRFDSQGDEIQKLLDSGAMLYYSDPHGLGRYARAGLGGDSLQVDRWSNLTVASTVGSDDRSVIPEMQKLVWAVVGNAQHNALVTHPAMAANYALYPFPPQARARSIPFALRGSLPHRAVKVGPAELRGPHRANRVVGEDEKGEGGWALKEDAWVQRYDYQPISSTEQGGNASSPVALPENNNWEWFAHQDSRKGLTESGSRWLAGVHEFRRLVAAHWLRIQHQLAICEFGVYVADPPGFPRNGKVAVNRVFAPGDDATWPSDEGGPGPVPPTNVKGILVNNFLRGGTSSRGNPSPAIGLGRSRLRGTDIMDEDMEAVVLDRERQLRYGLPSLERRVMYRTAALALWARVAPGAKAPYQIMDLPASELETAASLLIDKDPNIAGMLGDATTGLPDQFNPFLHVIEPPNPADIHPAQVLALSHLAHAAMMVTGYKPPFSSMVKDADGIGRPGERNVMRPSLEPLPDESLMYQDFDGANEFYLVNPFAPPVAGDPGFFKVGDPVSEAKAADPTYARLQRRPNGEAIRYRRKVGGVLSHFPPPYADRGAFAMDGKPTFKVTETRLSEKVIRRQIKVGDYAGPIGQDSLWARNAHETCLRWAMAYASENPHDYIVPKPYNRQNMMDRGLYQLALFDSGGRPRRTPSNDLTYPVVFGSTTARFGVAYGYPIFIDHPQRYQDLGGGRSPSETRGEYVEWAKPLPEKASKPWPDDRRDEDNFLVRSFGNGERVQMMLGRMHGYVEPGTAADKLPTWDPSTMADRTAPGPGYANQFTLYRPFDPAERDRQLVFWVVDWKQYEDSESAPSAPVDRFNVSNPESLIAWTSPFRQGTILNLPAATHREAVGDKGRNKEMIWDRYFNGIILQPRVGERFVPDRSPWLRLGAFGADRNGNGVFDRGPVGRTVRMKATEVARFNFYDPVATTNLRY